MFCTISLILYTIIFISCSIWNYKTMMKVYFKDQDYYKKIEDDNKRMRMLLKLAGIEYGKESDENEGKK